MRVLAVFSMLAFATALQLPSSGTTMKTKATVRPAVDAPKIFAAASAAFTAAQANVHMALAGGQSEGTGLILGIDDNREFIVLAIVWFAFTTLYFGWAKDQPDNDSDFFAEYDERRV